jgi:hypothetical protein
MLLYHLLLIIWSCLISVGAKLCSGNVLSILNPVILSELNPVAGANFLILSNWSLLFLVVKASWWMILVQLVVKLGCVFLFLYIAGILGMLGLSWIFICWEPFVDKLERIVVFRVLTSQSCQVWCHPSYILSSCTSGNTWWHRHYLLQTQCWLKAETSVL